jgi:hypothetical protein
VKECLATAFGNRPLDPDVARRGLAHVGFDLIELKLREIAGKRSGTRLACQPVVG